MNGIAKLKISGDVRTVLNGFANPNSTPSLKLANFPFALGAGRFSDFNFFGETLVFFHHAFGTRVTVNGETVTEEKEREIDSPFLLGMEIVERPKKLIIFKDLPFNEIQTLFLKNVSLGCFYVVEAIFDSFEGAYLKRSPIYSENINENQEKYWHKCDPFKHQHAFLFGVLVTEAGKQRLQNLDHAFYQNPNEKEQSVLSHTHAALTEERSVPKSLEDLKVNFFVSKILGVRHFLTQSRLDVGAFALFEITE